ncbi:hypothetical protein COLO4_17231 [Corchorus olitorius]|uniref:KIB1-4 beta-propeller domain-containing protein n=1 Tax=Corchorus olitorius TaxID=93759 RepID=A0A1R3JDH5_9ROSI|nr:hypothetical protein COLO4_17231 [Corchorus olitorius]
MEKIIRESSSSSSRCRPVEKHPRILLLDGRFHIIYVTCDDSRRPDLQSIPNLKNRKVWCCNNGWILISGEKRGKLGTSYDQFCVWKPECSKVIDLPPLYLKPNMRINAAIIIVSPNCDDEESGWTVLLFEHVLRYFISYRFGDGKWIHQLVGSKVSTISGGDDRDLIRMSYLAHCNENLYAATSQEGKMMVIKRNKFFSLTSLDYGLPLPSTIAHPDRVWDYLMDFGGQLYFVAVAWGGIVARHY